MDELIYNILGKVVSVTWSDDDCTVCEDVFCVSTFEDAKNCALTYANDVNECALLSNATNTVTNWQDLTCDLSVRYINQRI